jgi:methoxymalonate biosynthesis acyl carrier protein
MNMGTRQAIEAELAAFVQRHIRHPVGVDQDIFAQGGVTSLFAMQLVVHLEDQYGVRVSGPELNLDNFRTAQSMAALVERLGTPG